MWKPIHEPQPMCTPCHPPPGKPSIKKVPLALAPCLNFSAHAVYQTSLRIESRIAPTLPERLLRNSNTGLRACGERQDRTARIECFFGNTCRFCSCCHEGGVGGAISSMVQVLTLSRVYNHILLDPCGGQCVSATSAYEIAQRKNPYQRVLAFMSLRSHRARESSHGRGRRLQL